MGVDKTLNSSALRGGVVTGGAQVLKILIQFVSVPLLARLLLPQDFGLIASVSPLIAFVGIFQSLGLTQAIVQRADISEAQLNGIFRATLWLGLACALVTAALSPVVAWFYGDPRLLLIAATMGLPIALTAAASVPQGLLNRRMKFVALAGVDLLTTVVIFLTSVIGALAGLGFWSLALSSITGALTGLAGTWIAAGWRPSWTSADRLDRGIASFGANLTGFTFVNFFARNLDPILIGRSAGSVQLGLYDRAYKLLLFPLQNINGPLSRVMIPVLSRLQDDPAQFRSTFVRAIGQITLVAVPGVAAMLTVPDELTGLLFGPGWRGVAPIFAWLALAGLLEPIGNATGWIFIAQAQTQVMFRWGIYGAVTTVLGLLVGIRYGAAGVAAAYAIGHYLVRFPVLFIVVGRVSPVRARDLALTQLPLLAAAALSWVAVHRLVLPLLQLHGLWLVVAALICSYLAAIVVLLSFPAGRLILSDSRALLLKAVVKMTVKRGVRR